MKFPKLKDRLYHVAGEEPDFGALVKCCKTSSQAVKKWFGIGGETKDLRMSHLFKVADHYRIDARWLATGEGEPKPKSGALPPGLPPYALEFMKDYAKLPEEIQFPIRTLIQTLNTGTDPRYLAWSKREGDRAAARDAKAKKPINI